MRPKQLNYTLAALSVSGFVNAATGVGPFVTIAGSPADGTGHQVTLASIADLHLINMTLTGFDPEGRPQTEVIAGPNNNIVTSTKYFKSISSIVPAATLGVNTMNVGWNALCVTPIYPVDSHRISGVAMSVTIGGAVTYTEQQTVDDPFNVNPVSWFTLETGLSANDISSAPSGITGLRVLVASHTAGTLDINYSQGM